jgi:hypothetical protein
MRVLFLALLTACADVDTEPADTADLDTSEDTDTDTDTVVDQDPVGLVGDWDVQPCLVGERLEGSCGAWWAEQDAWDWVPAPGSCSGINHAAALAERLHVREDGTVGAEWDLRWTNCELEGTTEGTVTRELGTWAHAGGADYTVAGQTWAVVDLGKGLSVISGTDSMMLSAR